MKNYVKNNGDIKAGIYLTKDSPSQEPWCSTISMEVMDVDIGVDVGCRFYNLHGGF